MPAFESVLPPLREAAVLVPVYRDAAGRLRLVLVRRGEGGIHGGQLAFPGGKREVQDASLQATALRETHEEVGLPIAQVQVLATLPVIVTMVSSFRITPFLGHIHPPARWLLQSSEIAEVLDVEVAELLAPEAHTTEDWQLPGWASPRPISFYRIGPYALWGASYRIVQPLLPRLLAGEWAI